MSNATALNQAINLTNDILEVLEEKDFKAVSELEARRKALIEQAFSESIEQIDIIKAQHLQNMNQQVVDKLKVFKKSILQQQQQVQHAAKATRAYESQCF